MLGCEPEHKRPEMTCCPDTEDEGTPKIHRGWYEDLVAKEVEVLEYRMSSVVHVCEYTL